MADQRGDPPTEVPGPSAWGDEGLVQYVDANLDAYTPEALEAAIVGAGHDPVAAQAAMRVVRARRAARPVKSRARILVLIAYAITYAVFVLALLDAELAYGASGLAVGVLTVTMIPALAISFWWLRRRDAPITLLPLLFVPLIVLVAVGGACYATTGAPVPFIQHLLGQPAASPGI